MKPDRTNYEIWLVDYLDGTLDSERERELLLFLEENPDIREELSDMQVYRIVPSSENFHDKNSLKKTAEDIPESQFEILCVAASENDLSRDQITELEEIIAASPERRKTAGEIRRIKLKAPKAEFRYKSRLKKLTIPQRVFRYSVISVSAAAAIILLLTILRKPLPTLPDSRFLANSGDTIRVESEIIEKREIIEYKQPERITGNINQPVVAMNAGQEMVVSSETDTVSSPAFFRSNDISKIEYVTSVSLSSNEISQSLIAINTTMPLVNSEEDPGLDRTFAKFFRDRILKSETPEKGSLKAYEIADAGINGLNRLFGWEISLEKNKDEKGEVNSVYFNSRLLKFNAPVKKSESLE